MKHIIKTFILTILSFQLFAQIPPTFQWLTDGTGFRDVVEGEIVEISLPGNQEKVIVSKQQLTPSGIGRATGYQKLHNEPVGR